MAIALIPILTRTHRLRKTFPSKSDAFCILEMGSPWKCLHMKIFRKILGAHASAMHKNSQTQRKCALRCVITQECTQFDLFKLYRLVFKCITGCFCLLDSNYSYRDIIWSYTCMLDLNFKIKSIDNWVHRSSVQVIKCNITQLRLSAARKLMISEKQYRYGVWVAGCCIRWAGLEQYILIKWLDFLCGKRQYVGLSLA